MTGKAIATLLKANADLLLLVDTANIYPYILNEDTDLPAIIYEIDKVDADYVKEGWTRDEVTFSVSCIDENYSDLQDIAVEIRAALEWQSGTTAGITHWNIMHTGQVETYLLSDNVFINKQTFIVTVVGYS